MSPAARRPSDRDRASVVASSAPAATLAGRSVQHADHDDPWGAVLTLGDRAAKYGALIGLLIGLSTHGAAAGRALMALTDLKQGLEMNRRTIHEFLWTEYDIDLKQPDQQKAEPEKPKEEPPPTPEPDPIVQQAPKAVDKPQDPYDEKPAPVQAAKVLTAPTDPGKVEDLTGEGIVSGENTTGPLGGQSSAVGTSTVITHSPNADNTGKPGGTGTGGAPPPPPPSNKPDLSAPATLIGGLSWSCPFPSEADDEQIDYAQVTVIVTVRPDGSPQQVQVSSESPPGKGFGRAARMCALARRYGPGKDRDGNAITISTPPLRVTFTR